MNSVIKNYLDSKKIETKDELINSFREILQNIVLIGLSNGGFFKKASFYGGTALRIFHGIDRFSEDLDFTMLNDNDVLDFKDYFPYIQSIANSYGFDVTLSIKEKRNSNIESAFLKTNTLLTIFEFKDLNVDLSHLHQDEVMKIKFEVDIHPSLGFESEVKTLAFPEFSNVKTLDMPSLFAGKIAAILCRNYKNNVKGRDYYDFLFFVKNGIKPNMIYLANKLHDAGFEIPEDFELSKLKELLINKIETLDFDKVRNDVRPFVNKGKTLNELSKENVLFAVSKL